MVAMKKKMEAIANDKAPVKPRESTVSRLQRQLAEAEEKAKIKAAAQYETAVADLDRAIVTKTKAIARVNDLLARIDVLKEQAGEHLREDLVAIVNSAETESIEA